MKRSALWHRLLLSAGLLRSVPPKREPTIIRTLHSADGKSRVEISSDDGKLFRFVEISELWDEGYGDAPGSFYWTPTHLSGIYETAESAEADARATLPWLQSENSN